MQEQLVRRWVFCAALFGALGVGLGAFGAHGLRGILSPRDLEIYQTGVQYQLWHAMALLGAAFAASRWPGRLSNLAGLLFSVGIVLFSGSLYVLVLSGQRWLGAVTPLGGLSMIAGWLSLAGAAWRGARS
jgi:uncharacterized membrane protein YgdD (TMEM256/DUF423 family)